MSRFADGLDGRALRRLSSVRPTFDLCLLPFDISSRLISSAQREFFRASRPAPIRTLHDPTRPDLPRVQFSSRLIALCCVLLCFVVLLVCCFVVLLFCCFVVLLLCCFVVLLFCCFVVLLFCCFIVLLFCCFVVLLFCFFCFDVLVFCGFVVLLLYCFVVVLFCCFDALLL